MSPKDDLNIRISADNKVTEQLDPYVDPRVALVAEARDLFEKAEDLTFDSDELRYLVIHQMPRFTALAEKIGRPGLGLVKWATHMYVHEDDIALNEAMGGTVIVEEVGQPPRKIPVPPDD